MNIILFFLVVYTLSFAIVYKRPAIFRPIEWIFQKIGLGEALDCMLCMPMYAGAAISAFTLIFLPNLMLSPSFYLFGNPENWYYICAYIFIDMLSASGMIYLMDQVQVYMENNYRGHIDNRQMLND
jgi:hypothetical protein